jgi:hypothetical protein
MAGLFFWRYLNAGQRALVALDLEKLYAVAAKPRQAQAAGQPRGVKAEPSVVVNLPPETREKSREQAGAKMKVSGAFVQHAKKVTAVAPA